MHIGQEHWDTIRQIGIGVAIGAAVSVGTSASAWPNGSLFVPAEPAKETPRLLLLAQNETDGREISIDQVQEDLKALGFYGGTIDGVAGQGTWRALERFWAVAGVEVGDLTIPRAIQIGATADIVSARSVSVEEALRSADELVVVRSRWEFVQELFAAEDTQHAENWARELTERTGAILGETHPETFRARSSLANLIEALGRLPEAEDLFRKIWADREQVLGPEHPDTLKSIGSVLRCVLAQGKEEEAGNLIVIMAERIGG